MYRQFVFVISSTLLIATVSAGEFPEPPEEDVKNWTNGCATELGLSADTLFAEMKADPFGMLENPPHECLMKCLYEQSGFLTGGAFAFDKMIEIAKSIDKEAVKALQTCIDAIDGANECEKSMNFMRCKVKAHQSRM